MEAAIGYQKLDPHPKILPLIWACPNRGNDFQSGKATTLPGFQFCCHVDQQPWEAGCKLDLGAFLLWWNGLFRSGQMAWRMPS